MNNREQCNKLKFYGYSFSDPELATRILSKIWKEISAMQDVKVDIVVIPLKENPALSRYVVSLSKQDFLSIVTDEQSVGNTIKHIQNVVSSPFS